MKYIKAAALVALAVAVCLPAFAETQTVKVSGSLDAYWLYRKNLDLRDSNSAAVIPAGTAVPAGPAVGSAINRSDSADYFMSIAQVEIAADLTDNVNVVVSLFNQRDWNADTFTADSSGTVGRGAENAEGEFDVGVDLAYVQLKEFFYSPLTLTVGRQDIWLGRGFLIGDFNIQDPNNSIQANELSAVTSFDAIRGTLDFEPWTLDVIFINIDENSHDAKDGRTLWVNYANYQFEKYNAEADAYWIFDRNRAANSSAAGTLENKIHTIGGRLQFDPKENLTVGGEFAWQFGEYFNSTVDGRDREHKAFASEIFAEYLIPDNEWNTMLGIQYVHFSGDSGDVTNPDYEGWEPLFRGPTFGAIRDYQEVLYETALAADTAAGQNQEHFAFYGGFEPMDDLKVDASLYWFWNDEDLPASGGTRDNEIGTEFDINVNYDYTEDVALGVDMAWFFPGDLYDGGQGGTDNNTAGDVDETAVQVISSIKVAF